MKLKYLWMILVLSIPLSSCNLKEKSLVGDWGIAKITFLNNYYGYEIYTNTIVLYSDKTCFLPKYRVDQEAFYEDGHWRLEEHGDTSYLVIESLNDMFSGRYTILEQQNADKEGKLDIIRLKSSKLYLECNKVHGWAPSH